MDSSTKSKANVRPHDSIKNLTLSSYLKSELKRGYLLENDEERYAERREKVYTFFMIPRETEKFFAYGFFQCADSFTFVLTFLPLRFLLAFWALLLRILGRILRIGRPPERLLKPAEIVDLVKGVLLVVCCYVMAWIDTSVLYHLIKTQSTIKLYLFFNILEIADRLMSAFGQDTLDALFWTATEPGGRKRERVGGVVFHLLVALVSVFLHATIVLLQALALNVAINADNKGLLTILISNNFVELKGSVFKKFDRINLLQIACSDVRERFHLCVLMLVVALQTLKEYNWSEERLYILLPDCLLVCGTEVLVDWIKHAFVTRFNDIPIEAYRDYTTILAHDLVMCKQKYADSDHSDLVARRMGFIPLPLGVVTYRILSQSLPLHNATAFLLLALAFAAIITFRVLNGIIMLGKACDLLDDAERRKAEAATASTAADRRSDDLPAQSSSTPVKTTNSSSLGKPAASNTTTTPPAATSSISSVIGPVTSSRSIQGDLVLDSIITVAAQGAAAAPFSLAGVPASSGSNNLCCNCCHQRVARRTDEEDGLEYLTPHKATPADSLLHLQQNRPACSSSSSPSTVPVTCEQQQYRSAIPPAADCRGATSSPVRACSLPPDSSSCWSPASSSSLHTSCSRDDCSSSGLFTTPFTTPTHLVKRVKGKRVRLDSGAMVQEIEPYPYHYEFESESEQQPEGYHSEPETQDVKSKLRLKLDAACDAAGPCVNVSSPNDSTPNSPGSFDVSPSLSFSHDPQAGLMANSMVNLASVGLNQGPHSPEVEVVTASLRSSCASLSVVDDEAAAASTPQPSDEQQPRPASWPSADLGAATELSAAAELGAAAEHSAATELSAAAELSAATELSATTEHIVLTTSDCDRPTGCDKPAASDKSDDSGRPSGSEGPADSSRPAVNERAAGSDIPALSDRPTARSLAAGAPEDNSAAPSLAEGRTGSLGCSFKAVSAPDVRISEGDSDQEDDR